LLLPLLVWQRAREQKPDIAVLDPYSDGWGAERLYARLLKFLVQELDRQGKAGRPALALWSYDREKECAWCVAAEGYGREYLHEIIIGKTPNSQPCVIQSVCEEARPSDCYSIKIIDPQQHSQFMAKETVRRRGVTKVAYIPVHWFRETPIASYVLAVYFFQNIEETLDMSIRTALATFAGRFHCLVDNLRDQRWHLAVADVLRCLAVESPSDPFRVHALRRALEKIFGAVVTIYGHLWPMNESADNAKGRLVPLTTTHGMLPFNAEQSGVHAAYLVPGDSPELERFALDLNDPQHQGVTSWLATHRDPNRPNLTDRRLNLVNNREPRPNGSPPAGLTGDREYPFVRGSEPRRFLAGRVMRGDDVLLVLRLTRPALERPFRESDDWLLQALVTQPEVVASGERWRASQLHLPSDIEDDNLPLRELERTIQRQLEELRGSLTGAGTIGLHEVRDPAPTDEKKMSLQLYTQSPPQGAAAGSLHGSSVDVPRSDLVRLSPLGGACAVTGRGELFGPELDLVFHQHLRGEVWVAFVPVLFWGGTGPTQMILSVTNENKPVPEADLCKLLRAGLGLAEECAERRTTQLLSGLGNWPWIDALRVFSNLVKGAVPGAEVHFLPESPRHQSAEWRRPSEVLIRSCWRVEPYTPNVLVAAERYGLKLSPDECNFSVPLRAGPVEVGEVCWPRCEDWPAKLYEMMKELNDLSVHFFRLTEGRLWEFHVSLSNHGKEGTPSVWKPTFQLIERDSKQSPEAEPA